VGKLEPVFAIRTSETCVIKRCVVLISEKNKFLFIHIYKNAGASIAKALRPYSSSKVELMLNKPLRKIGIHIFDPSPFPDHLTALQIMERLGRDHFMSLYRFAIVRNPWDWQVSLYNYALKDKTHFEHGMTKAFSGFEEYLEWRCDGNYQLQKDFIYDSEGNCLVNFTGRFENLDNDFKVICNTIGVQASLPKVHVLRSDDYRGHYSLYSRTLIEKTFEEDIRMFGYEF